MISVDLALAALALTFLLALVRVAAGPSLADRALAADVCLFTIVGAIALLSVRLGVEAFLDVVVVSTLLGFIATISLARLIRRTRK